jgi:tetratricopeptide (TPR) repeat protein
MQRMEAAAKLFELAFRKNDLQIQSLVQHRHLMLKLGRFEDAARSFENATRMAPTSAVAFNNLGVSHEMHGELQRAQQSFAEAARLEPANPTFVSNLCMVKLRMDPSAATEVIEKLNVVVHTTAGTAPMPLFVRGVAYHSRSATRGEAPDHIHAMKNYQAALAADPSFFYARVLSAQLSISRGDLAAAQVHMDWLEIHHPQ